MRRRVQAGFTSSALRNLVWQIDGQASSGTPYSIQTGFDDNGDLIFNDRSAGVGRNTARAATHATFGLLNSTPHGPGRGALGRAAMESLLHRMAHGALRGA